MSHDTLAPARLDRHTLMRWLFSGLFAATAVWSLCATAVSLVRSPDGWGAAAFIGVFGLLFATPFALSTCFCFKRRYGDLFMVGAVVAAFFVLSLGFAIPEHLGAFDAIHKWKGGDWWRPMVMLLLSLLLLLGPFYLAGWFLQACSRFAARRLPNGPTPGN